MQQLLVVVMLCTLTQSCCVSHAATTNQSNTVWLDITLNKHDLDASTDENGDGTMTNITKAITNMMPKTAYLEKQAA